MEEALPPVVDGRFEVLGTLGRGGMGIVYRAYDRERGVEVALKTLRGITPESVLRFKAEFRSMRDVRHQNLVALGELFESDGTWFFTMDRVHGVHLLDWVRGRPVRASSSSSSSSASPSSASGSSSAGLAGAESPTALIPVGDGGTVVDRTVVDRLAAPPCDVGRLRTALAGLARGLAALHAKGIVHRDVKPSNVLVDDTGHAMVLDFGTVAELEHARAAREKYVIGTITYMAPEQARGDSIGPAADWYAVGVLLFQALTGQLPFGAAAGQDLLALKQVLAAPAPSDLVENVPDDLDWLCRALLHTDPAMRPEEPRILAMLGVGPDDEAQIPGPSGTASPFVGRTDELAALDRAFEASRERAVCVFVDGESGVGKSTLVDHFVRRVRARHQRAVVLRGRCHERERVAFNALDGAIDDLARYLLSRPDRSVDRVAPEHTPDLLAVFPALRAVQSLTDRMRIGTPGRLDRLDASDIRGRAFAGLCELLSRLAARRPLVILVDDVQWADRDSVGLLEQLLATNLRACVIATRRAREGQWVAQRVTAAAVDFRQLELGGLSSTDAAQLVRLVAGDEEIHSARIIAESRGHPLFLRELARHRTASAATARLEDVIWARSRQLAEPARQLLAVVAVAGSPVPRHVACSTAGLAAADAERSIASLVEENLVRVHGPRPQDAIEPFHDRVRGAVTAHEPAERQRVIHGELARALEAVGASAEELLARFEGAGDLKRAAHYMVAAAKAAFDGFAFGRAAELYKRALDGATSPERRVALLIQLAEALLNDGRSADAGECYAEAASLETNDAAQLDLLRRAAERFLMAGRLDRGLETARAVLRRVNMTLPTTRARTLSGIVWNQMRMRSLTWRTRTEIDPRSLHADICWSLGAGLGMVDTLLGAYFSGRGARLALSYGTPFQIARSLAAATIGAAVLGRRERAAALYEAGRRAAHEDGTPVAAWYADLAQTAREFILDNDFAKSYESASKLEDEWYAAGRGPGWETDVAMHFALSSQQMRGRYAEMARRVASQVGAAKRKGDLFQDVTLRVRFAMRHLLVGQPDVAHADLDDALASWLPGTDSFGNQRAWGLWSRIRVVLYTGELATLEQRLGAECQRMRKSLVGRLPILRLEWFHVYGTYLVGLAAAARKRGAASEAAAHVREASAVADRLGGMPFPGALTSALTLVAAIANIGDDREMRVSTLRAAIEETTARGIHVFTPCMERRLGEELGGDEGARMIATADERARAVGFVEPERAAEVFGPTGRFT